MPATKEVEEPPSRYRTGFCGGSMHPAGANKWVFVSYPRDSHQRCTKPAACACPCHKDPYATPWFDHLTEEQRRAYIKANPRPTSRRVPRRPQRPAGGTPPPVSGVGASIPAPRRVPRRPVPRPAAVEPPPTPRRIPRRPTR